MGKYIQRLISSGYAASVFLDINKSPAQAGSALQERKRRHGYKGRRAGTLPLTHRRCTRMEHVFLTHGTHGSDPDLSAAVTPSGLPLKIVVSRRQPAFSESATPHKTRLTRIYQTVGSDAVCVRHRTAAGQQSGKEEERKNRFNYGT